LWFREKGFLDIFHFRSTTSFTIWLYVVRVLFGTAVGSGDIEVVVTSTLVRLYMNVMCVRFNWRSTLQLKKDLDFIHYIICIVLCCPSPSNRLYCDHQGHYLAI